MISIIVISALVGGVAAFIVLLAEKWGMVEGWERMRNTSAICLPEFCMFCFAFWVSVILTPVMVMAFGMSWSWTLVMVPAMATGLIRVIVR